MDKLAKLSFYFGYETVLRVPDLSVTHRERLSCIFFLYLFFGVFFLNKFF